MNDKTSVQLFFLHLYSIRLFLPQQAQNITEQRRNPSLCSSIPQEEQKENPFPHLSPSSLFLSMASFQDSLFKSKISQPSTSAKHPTPSHPSKNHHVQFPDSLNSAFRRSASCRPSISSSSTAALPTKRLGSSASDKIVVYFTSLRGIRRTYEDCCAVLSILAGFRVLVDERDVSMDAAYRRELQGLLSQPAVALPQVFVRGKHVGGAEEVRMLYETGELAKILEGLPLRNPGLRCKHCGNARFVLCGNCDGSRKVFVEEEGRLRRCPECNEHGLVRCEFCL